MSDRLNLQEICDQSPIHRRLRIRVEADPGGLSLRARLGPGTANAGDGLVVHGGLIAVLLDAAATLALIAETGSDWTTVDLRVDYLLPLATGAVGAGAEVLSVARTLARARAWISGPDGRQAALAIGTFRRARQLVAADAG